MQRGDRRRGVSGDNARGVGNDTDNDDSLGGGQGTAKDCAAKRAACYFDPRWVLLMQLLITG